jgi:hypothetical protein
MSEKDKILYDFACQFLICNARASYSETQRLSTVVQAGSRRVLGGTNKLNGGEAEICSEMVTRCRRMETNIRKTVEDGTLNVSALAARATAWE